MADGTPDAIFRDLPGADEEQSARLARQLSEMAPSPEGPDDPEQQRRDQRREQMYADVRDALKSPNLTPQEIDLRVDMARQHPEFAQEHGLHEIIERYPAAEVSARAAAEAPAGAPDTVPLSLGAIAEADEAAPAPVPPPDQAAAHQAGPGIITFEPASPANPHAFARDSEGHDLTAAQVMGDSPIPPDRTIVSRLKGIRGRVRGGGQPATPASGGAGSVPPPGGRPPTGPGGPEGPNEPDDSEPEEPQANLPDQAAPAVHAPSPEQAAAATPQQRKKWREWTARQLLDLAARPDTAADTTRIQATLGQANEAPAILDPVERERRRVEDKARHETIPAAGHRRIDGPKHARASDKADAEVVGNFAPDPVGAPGERLDPATATPEEREAAWRAQGTHEAPVRRSRQERILRGQQLAWEGRQGARQAGRTAQEAARLAAQRAGTSIVSGIESGTDALGRGRDRVTAAASEALTPVRAATSRQLDRARRAREAYNEAHPTIREARQAHRNERADQLATRAELPEVDIPDMPSDPVELRQALLGAVERYRDRHTEPGSHPLTEDETHAYDQMVDGLIANRQGEAALTAYLTREAHLARQEQTPDSLDELISTGPRVVDEVDPAVEAGLLEMPEPATTDERRPGRIGRLHNLVTQADGGPAPEANVPATPNRRGLRRLFRRTPRTTSQPSTTRSPEEIAALLGQPESPASPVEAPRPGRLNRAARTEEAARAHREELLEQYRVTDAADKSPFSTDFERLRLQMADARSRARGNDALSELEVGGGRNLEDAQRMTQLLLAELDGRKIDTYKSKLDEARKPSGPISTVFKATGRGIGKTVGRGPLRLLNSKKRLDYQKVEEVVFATVSPDVVIEVMQRAGHSFEDDGFLGARVVVLPHAVEGQAPTEPDQRDRRKLSADFKQYHGRGSFTPQRRVEAALNDDPVARAAAQHKVYLAELGRSTAAITSAQNEPLRAALSARMQQPATFASQAMERPRRNFTPRVIPSPEVRPPAQPIEAAPIRPRAADLLEFGDLESGLTAVRPPALERAHRVMQASYEGRQEVERLEALSDAAIDDLSNTADLVIARAQADMQAGGLPIAFSAVNEVGEDGSVRGNVFEAGSRSWAVRRLLTDSAAPNEQRIAELSAELLGLRLAQAVESGAIDAETLGAKAQGILAGDRMELLPESVRSLNPTRENIVDPTMPAEVFQEASRRSLEADLETAYFGDAAPAAAAGREMLPPAALRELGKEWRTQLAELEATSTAGWERARAEAVVENFAGLDVELSELLIPKPPKKAPEQGGKKSKKEPEADKPEEITLEFPNIPLAQLRTRLDGAIQRAEAVGLVRVDASDPVAGVEAVVDPVAELTIPADLRAAELDRLSDEQRARIEALPANELSLKWTREFRRLSQYLNTAETFDLLDEALGSDRPQTIPEPSSEPIHVGTVEDIEVAANRLAQMGAFVRVAVDSDHPLGVAPLPDPMNPAQPYEPSRQRLEALSTRYQRLSRSDVTPLPIQPRDSWTARVEATRDHVSEWGEVKVQQELRERIQIETLAQLAQIPESDGSPEGDSARLAALAEVRERNLANGALRKIVEQTEDGDRIVFEPGVADPLLVDMNERLSENIDRALTSVITNMDTQIDDIALSPAANSQQLTQALTRYQTLQQELEQLGVVEVAGDGSDLRRIPIDNPDLVRIDQAITQNIAHAEQEIEAQTTREASQIQEYEEQFLEAEQRLASRFETLADAGDPLQQREALYAIGREAEAAGLIVRRDGRYFRQTNPVNGQPLTAAVEFMQNYSDEYNRIERLINPPAAGPGSAREVSAAWRAFADDHVAAAERALAAGDMAQARAELKTMTDAVTSRGKSAGFMARRSGAQLGLAPRAFADGSPDEVAQSVYADMVRVKQAIDAATATTTTATP